jgi:cob(I)alamin adenosyltransferase
MQREIDRMEATLPPLRNFVLPGGSPPAALLHLARAVARRAERGIVSLARSEKVSPAVLVYVNRLSDYLFVAARAANRRSGSRETVWRGARRAPARETTPPARPKRAGRQTKSPARPGSAARAKSVPRAAGRGRV